jgi:hypothetical protein
MNPGCRTCKPFLATEGEKRLRERVGNPFCCVITEEGSLEPNKVITKQKTGASSTLFSTLFSFKILFTTL